MLAGWPVLLTASAFNRLGQYASGAGNRAYCYAELAGSLAVAVTIASTYCTYTHTEMARLSRSEWLVKYQDGWADRWGKS